MPTSPALRCVPGPKRPGVRASRVWFRAARTASASVRAVPLGASVLWRWWLSTISTS